MCKVKIVIRSQWFKDNPLVLKFLVERDTRVGSHGLHCRFIVVWGKHLVLASSLAFHAEDVYFIVLQDWTYPFKVVWISTSSWCICLAIPKDGVYFMVLQDWTYPFKVVWTNISSWRICLAIPKEGVLFHGTTSLNTIKGDEMWLHMILDNGVH